MHTSLTIVKLRYLSVGIEELSLLVGHADETLVDFGIAE